jgi:hypothetical protein
MNQLKNQVENADQKTLTEVFKKEAELKEQLNHKEQSLKALEAKIELSKKESQLQTQQILSSKEKELQDLKTQLEVTIKIKDDEIQRYKDFKAKQNVKLLGENLEQHCQTAFDQVRMMAFKNAKFGKDNDAKDGTKGDFIFRDFDDQGVEILSIMFEMKNEGDDSATKQKNEQFFKKLDKDRNEKKCEYAVLVSTLEADNEVYNAGITDVSYQYEKMYVVRPQFFIPMITLLRNAALNVLSYKQEVHLMRQQNVDVVEFEKQLDEFKTKFGYNFRLASERFKKAIDEIDNSIKNLQNTKDALLSSEKNLRLANDKAEDLTIKKLTKNSPSLKEQYEKKV